MSEQEFEQMRDEVYEEFSGMDGYDVLTFLADNGYFDWEEDEETIQDLYEDLGLNDEE